MKACFIALGLLAAPAVGYTGMPQTGMQNMMQIYSMQEFSSMYATSLLELQASWMWLQAADSMEKLSIVGASDGSPSSPAMGLEEGASSIEHELGQSFLELGEGDMSMLMEHETEKSLLALVKLQYIQAAHRLGTSQESHYQAKVVLARLGPLAATMPQLQTLAQLLYYRDMLELVTTCVTIQKQDIWNFWIFNEMVETDMFSEGVDMPEEFSMRMAVARLQSMSQFQMQAGLELASMVMDYYIQKTVESILGPYIAQMGASPPAGATPASYMTQMGPYAQGTSFLETGTQTGTGTQFVPSMALGGLFGWAQFLPYIKFYTAWIKYYVASELAVLSQVDAMTLIGKDSPMAAHKPQIMAFQTMPLLKQWTQLRLMLALYDFYSKTGAISGMPTFASPAADGSMGGVQQGLQPPSATPLAGMWQMQDPMVMPQQQYQMAPQMGNPMADMMAGVQNLLANEPTTTDLVPDAVPPPEAVPATESDDSSLIGPAKVPKLSGTQTLPVQLANTPAAEPSLLG